MCTIFIEEEGTNFTISCDHLEPIAPQVNDKVKILIGEERGMVGTLLSIDGQEGVVQFENERNPKLIQTRILCRFQQN